MRFLLLWLEAPLQSWGYDSRFDLRQTFSFPTKSGVYGILLASSGDSGPQCELLRRMKDAPFTAVSMVPKDPKNSNGQADTLLDYQVVGNGYESDDKWVKLHSLRTSEGKTSVGGGAKLTYRYYLQDRKFAVILGLDDDLAEKFARSLTAPVFDLYLGRKCCVPTDFIFRGTFDSEEAARAEMLRIAGEKQLRPDKELIQLPVDVEALTEDGFFLTDVPLQFGPVKRYADRFVRIVDLSVSEESPDESSEKETVQ